MLHDRWRIVSELGRGGMGEVYLAEHVSLGRKEALKILMPSIAADPQFVARFRREARAVNRLRHPNIVAIYDFGQLPDGRFYLSMEYAEGINLFRLLRRNETLAVPRALHLLGQLAHALHHAHSRGVVHRDLKPGNLIVCGADETLKVLDFGMAKVVAPDFAETNILSSGNVIWGTAKYISPERARGIADDPRSDLYSIGCIGFEMLAGATPFDCTAQEAIYAHLNVEIAPPSVWRPSVAMPKELDEVILRCLAKRPEDRFQTAADLYAALRKVPGYPVPKQDARRRFVPAEKAPQELPPPAEPNVRGALREVAEALLDLGEDDAQLVAGIAYLRDHERALVRIEAAQDALEHEAAAVRETVGDREISLRFAIGELRFAASLAANADTSRIGELEDRLAAAVADGDRLRALEQGIASISQMRVEALGKLKDAYDALETTVADILSARKDVRGYRRISERFEVVRARRQGQ